MSKESRLFISDTRTATIGPDARTDESRRMPDVIGSGAKNRLLNQILEASRFCALVLDESNYLRYITPEASKLLGLSDALVGQHICSYSSSNGIAVLAELAGLVRSSSGSFEREFPLRAQRRRFMVSAELLSGNDLEHSSNVLCTFSEVMDPSDPAGISETEMFDELRRAMQESQHRVKNMMSNILARVGRARREATEDIDVIDVLSRRITALSHTHEVLSQENWRAADLHSLITPELSEVYGPDRVSIDGPAMIVNERAALSLSMAIHELATNAAKYGAFRNDDGHVKLTWRRQDSHAGSIVVFDWKERGVPASAVASKSGFGTRLIQSTIADSLGGRIETLWEHDGLRVVFSIPYKEMQTLEEASDEGVI